MQASFSLFQRFLTAIIGLLLGGFIGMLALYYAMLVVDSDFGMDNVRPGGVIGGVIGVFVGLWFPHRWSWRDLMTP